MADIFLKEESYKIVGVCMEVHRELGVGFKEAVYKDALELEFKAAEIPFTREKSYTLRYKGKILPRKYFADFVVFNSIILEVKATPVIINPFVYQTINYLKASGIKLGIIANFGNKSLGYKRVVF
ncbi:MAG TPA: GxxExxY protein [Chitinophagaceae bacterium]|nr:GxxExxY protein [Chitinophagaceae bacterium]